MIASRRNASKRSLPALVLIFSVLSSGVCRQPAGEGLSGPGAQPPAQQGQKRKGEQSQDEDVVKVTTNLVQVDAVVTDDDGKVVRDLRAEDFEVLEDGRPQPVTHFSFFSPDSSPGGAQPVTPAPVKRDKSLPPAPPPPATVHTDQVQRTIALVVDDLNLSFESTDRVRESLKKFVNEQMQPGDLVAIIYTSGSGGALQQFTADKRLLARAIEKARWTPRMAGGVGPDTFEPAKSDTTFKMIEGGARSFETGEAKKERERIEGEERELHGNATLGALSLVARAMRRLPGRKSVVFLSDGLPLTGRTRVYDAMQIVTDLAYRAGVVFYTLDARGVLDATFISAADDVVVGLDTDEASPLRLKRSAFVNETRSGLYYLADQTGGIFMHSMNDLSKGVRRALDDQQGYYLLGFRPSEETFKGRQFHKITVQVRRPGLHVRSRKGFYGHTDDAVASAAFTGDRQLYAALASPLSAGDIPVRLTPFFGADARSGSFVRSLLHIDGKDITFTDEGNGQKRLTLDVAAVTFGEDGRIVDQFNRTHTVHVNLPAYQHVMVNGLTYTADVPVKKPGAYQLRVVLRDAASGRIGSAGQYVEVPDLKNNRLTLSGLVLAEADPAGAQGLPPGAAAEAALSPTPSLGSLAVRRLRPGTVMAFSYLIYNPRTDRATGRPKLTTQVRLFQEGREVFASPEAPFDLSRQTDLRRLVYEGSLRLRPQALPGNYTLQVVVNDDASGESRRTATQWIDFEIVK